jgi:predicted metal-dependent hydrolase
MPATATVPRNRRPALRPRSLKLDFASPIPRYWFGGSAVATHTANGVNMLFPAGERFFVRSVKHYADRITDPALRSQIRGFFGQEGSHAREHERVLTLLEEQGYEIRRFLAFYDRVAFKLVERLSSPELRLSTTAACEHFTSIMAENALRQRVLDRCHPAMRDLLLWHSAEEIEHRAVAFDVLQQVNPDYSLRVAGLMMATALLGGFWAIGAASLVWQDKALGPRRLLAEWRAMRANKANEAVFLPGIREYLRRDFHPSQKDTDRLADEYLASVGLA